jgi:hypothetical protein
MNHSRETTFEHKLISKNNLRQIAQVLIRNQSKPDDVKFHVKCEDNATYSSNSINIFDDGGPLDQKRIEKIEMSLTNNKYGKCISINLQQGGHYFKGSFDLRLTNKIIVKGNDEDWVIATFTKLDEQIEAITVPDNWVIRFYLWILIINMVGVGILAVVLINLSTLLGEHFNHVDESRQPILFWFLTILMGFSGGGYITSKLVQSWPSVEFDFGPEHRRKERRRKNSVGLFFSFGVAPLVIMVIYDLIKYGLHT